MTLLPAVQARPSGAVPPTGLTIRISTGVGVGRTRLSAFDAALMAAGVGDFNLVRLSSVIPPGSEVVQVDGDHQVARAHGDRLYCVYAAGYSSTPFEEAWAGIAWSRRNDDSGEGLFVEHEGVSRASVDHDLSLSLADLSERRGSDFTAAGTVLTSGQCMGHPVCALVVATYSSTPWGLREQ